MNTLVKCAIGITVCVVGYVYRSTILAAGKGMVTSAKGAYDSIKGKVRAKSDKPFQPKE